MAESTDDFASVDSFVDRVLYTYCTNYIITLSRHVDADADVISNHIFNLPVAASAIQITPTINEDAPAATEMRNAARSLPGAAPRINANAVMTSTLVRQNPNK